MAEKNKEAPGEVRSNTQVVTRILLLVVILVVVGGFLLALFRRPERVLDEASFLAPELISLLQIGS